MNIEEIRRIAAAAQNGFAVPIRTAQADPHEAEEIISSLERRLGSELPEDLSDKIRFAPDAQSMHLAAREALDWVDADDKDANWGGERNKFLPPEIRRYLDNPGLYDEMPSHGRLKQDFESQPDLRGKVNSIMAGNHQLFGRQGIQPGGDRLNNKEAINWQDVKDFAGNLFHPKGTDQLQKTPAQSAPNAEFDGRQYYGGQYDSDPAGLVNSMDWSQYGAPAQNAQQAQQLGIEQYRSYGDPSRGYTRSKDGTTVPVSDYQRGYAAGIQLVPKVKSIDVQGFNQVSNAVNIEPPPSGESVGYRKGWMDALASNSKKRKIAQRFIIEDQMVDDDQIESQIRDVEAEIGQSLPEEIKDMFFAADSLGDLWRISEDILHDLKAGDRKLLNMFASKTAGAKDRRLREIIRDRKRPAKFEKPENPENEEPSVLETLKKHRRLDPNSDRTFPAKVLASTKIECEKCGGKGEIPSKSGKTMVVCFPCEGTGKVSSDYRWNKKDRQRMKATAQIPSPLDPGMGHYNSSSLGMGGAASPAELEKGLFRIEWDLGVKLPDSLKSLILDRVQSMQDLFRFRDAIADGLKSGDERILKFFAKKDRLALVRIAQEMVDPDMQGPELDEEIPEEMDDPKDLIQRLESLLDAMDGDPDQEIAEIALKLVARLDAAIREPFDQNEADARAIDNEENEMQAYDESGGIPTRTANWGIDHHTTGVVDHLKTKGVGELKELLKQADEKIAQDPQPRYQVARDHIVQALEMHGIRV